MRAAAGYATGGVPPFGHFEPLPTLMDASLYRWDQGWAAAGPTHRLSIPVPELERVTNAHLVEIG